jgi:hypothetical protein
MLACVRALLIGSLLLCVSCDKPRDSATQAAPHSGTPATREQRDPPASKADAAASLEPQLRSERLSPSVAVAKHSCVVRSDQELGSGERTAVAFLGGRALVIASESSGRSLALFTQQQSEPFVRRASRSLSASAQRVTLVCRDDCELALVDDKARLLAFEVAGERIEEAGVLASGVDRRFAPALYKQAERSLYAYTSTVDEAMHTLLVVRSAGRASAPRDLTPLGHGAAAPTFVLGAARPTLVAIDARAGMSPLLEITFDERASPQPASVRTPVSAPYAPPLLAAVAWAGDGDTEVVYTAIGRAAMTAVGRVPLRSASEPTALSPSRGYGELAFSAAWAEQAALFAIEVPSGVPAAAKRTLTFKLSDGSHTYDALSIDGAGEAARPSLAASSIQGEYLVGYTSAGKVHAALLACAL